MKAKKTLELIGHEKDAALILASSAVSLLIFLFFLIEPIQAGRIPQSFQVQPQVKTFAAIKQDLVRTDKTTGQLDLIDNNQFQIIYSIPDDHFIVRLKGEGQPFVDKKTAAENWFKAKGFQAQDLCRLYMTIVPPKKVKITPEDLRPAGCPAPSS